MKYLRQICLILLFSFLGEVCRAVIPFPIPASIYGMVLLFAALALKIIRLKQVQDAGHFLSSFLPVLFVAPLVSLMDCWDALKDAIGPIAVIVLVSTMVTFAVSGLTTKWIMGRGGKRHG